MLSQIRAFVEAHPEGWGHEEWLGLLAELGAAGVDVSDPDAIGATLEHERLAARLSGLDVKGLGPKRIEALADRYRTLWILRHASAEDVASIKTVPTDVAERVVEALGRG
jgi:hypothetical protein